MNVRDTTDGIALIGLAGRFPGAPDATAFWKNLCAGVESISRFDDLDPETPNLVRARSLLDDVDLFDAGFFGMQSREADLTDPQHRILLECCWEALEDAGYDPAAYAGSIGVAAGSSINTYFLRNVMRDRETLDRFTNDYQVDSFPELLGAGHDFLATRVAYKLNLRGPALTVQSACSTALLAVVQAAQSLLLGQADMMLAGAVSVTFPQKRGYLHQDGGMVSADGHCRSFDAQASGTVFGSGAGVVVLKRLADALADGDPIYAVMRGFGINNDGSAKIGYTAPSAEGQTAAIRAAHAMAGFAPRSISYVECHGTATPLGDPIEFAALRKAFAASPEDGKFCAIGSVKTNVGHLDVAAGMSGLIKTALAIKHGTIPPTLHFTAPNPHLNYDESPFFVATESLEWPDDARRAGVSAFGLGGTNVHVVLEAPPAAATAPASRAPQLIVLSARSEAALANAQQRLAAHLETQTSQSVEDVAFTLQTGRRQFAHRASLAASSAQDAIEKLRSGRGVSKGSAAATAPSIAFMFPGQGAQYVGMGRDLYEKAPVFREAIDRCADILEPLLNKDLRSVLYPASDGAVAAYALTATELAQPAIFAVEYALARLWLQWGIEPAATIGHSVGEFVAATLAGVMSLEDALALVAERGRLMQSLPAGAMLAVRLSEGDLQELLVPPLAIAAVNAPALSVAAGPVEAIEKLEKVLAARDVSFRRLDTSHAFHSPMMDAVVAPLRARVAAISLSAPARRWVSTVTGNWITDEEATSPDYWAQHCRKPVRFAAGLATLAQSGISALLEVGPGSALATFARQLEERRELTIVASLPSAERNDAEFAGMLEALGKLWSAGAKPKWQALHAGAAPHRVSLPTYPFERTRHWIDAPASAPKPVREAAPVSAITEDTTTENIAKESIVTENVPSEDALKRTAIALLEELSGETIAPHETGATFLELGFDSLLLGRFVQQLQTRFGVAITFRQLLGEIPSIDALIERIAPMMPATSAPAVAAAPAPTAASAAPGSVEALMREQLAAMQDLMQQQLRALQSVASAKGAAQPPALPAPSAAQASAPKAEPSRFDAFKVRDSGASSELTFAQQAHIEALIERTVARTIRSKELTQKYRSVLADPRVAAGFRSEWKEMVYPITCVRANGSRLWDIDGNEYIDLLNGFGQTAFGHAPGFVVDAVTEQLQRGFAIGPQTDLAGEVATLFCELTGNERVTFCNTGSEAVMAALRVARTVTGRNRVVLFNGAYHGQFDEVLVKSARNGPRALPVAPGIPTESVANMSVLDYGDPASLEWIREHASELAAVVVEPVQSRHPNLQPKAFLQELRAITAAAGTALVFDEVVTGFRMHPGGMQAVFDIRADLATYGKVAGGGMPIGILAGTTRFMDALDGGMWQYGDDSVPEVAPTFFAGTFVRHPLVMAAVLAVLKHLQAEGPALQAALSARMAGLVERLNAEFARRNIAGRIETCGSVFYFNFTAEERLASLLYYHLRNRGIYIQEGFPCFLTTEHTAQDVDAIVRAFAESLDELQGAGIFAHALPESALTEEQTEVWLAAQLGDEASCAFNESVTLRFSGTLDEPAFAAAWKSVIARHEALRASFGRTGETMRIAAQLDFAYPTVDANSTIESELEAKLAGIVAKDAATPFDLAEGPLVRGVMLRSAEGAYAFVFTAHHIVCDGWSMNVILEEVAASYRAAVTGTSAALLEPVSFRAYARAERERNPAERAAVESFWIAQFAEPATPLELPADRPRAALKSFHGATRSAHLDAAATAALKKAGARNGCTLFVTLLGAFEALMGRLAGQSDVVVGIPAAGQALLEGDAPLVGHCVDFLPIRNSWDGETTLGQLLTSLKRRVLDAYEHQNYTLGTLVRKLSLQRQANRLPLTEIQFNLERLSNRLQLGAQSATVEPNPKAYVNFDLFLNVVESDDGLRLDCDYNTDLFDATTIDRWLAYYRTLLDEIVRDQSLTVSRVDYVPREETRLLRTALAGDASEYARDATVHSLFEAQAAVRPHAIAVTCGDVSLTYAELDNRANRLAHFLLAHTDAPGRLVGVAIERSCEMLVALLATLKAGCAYVPLDPSHPPARLQQIVDDSGLAVLLTDGSIDGAFSGGTLSAIDIGREAATIEAQPAEIPLVARDGSDLAYAIYTSGSTGRPKGVEIEHRSVVNLLCAMAREPGLSADDVLLAVTTISFDIAALELFLPLSAGATVAIAARGETSDGFRLLERLKSTGATMMQGTPATWRLMIEAGFAPHPGLKMLCGGEALRFDLATELLQNGGKLWNMYGPTETTIWSSCKRIEPGAPVTVGRPISNTHFYVLDGADEPVPFGQTGQLHIGGDGVARGYLNRPELTAEKFVANPFDGGRMYRTGDIARVLANGDVEILGRSDAQIKLRGFRIELGEIENAMLATTGVLSAAVLLREDTPGEQRLVAYYVERIGSERSPAELRARLGTQLPEYMLPSAWVRLAALPLTANGKVDRNALPAPERPETEDDAFAAPQTEVEKTLAQIWGEVLQIERVGLTDDLFALGADSIHLFKIVARANRQGIALAAKELFKHRTIAQLANHLEPEGAASL